MNGEFLSVFDDFDFAQMPRCFVREFCFEMLETVVTIRLYDYLAPGGSMVGSIGYELSHYINTPVQADPYVPSQRRFQNESEALRDALWCFKQHYDEAVAAGQDPAMNSLERNSDFR